PSPTPPPQDGESSSSAAVGSQLTRSSSLQLILSSISAERGKSNGNGPDGRSRFWTNLLIAHFLEEDERSVNGGGSAPANGDLKDDLVFYVRRRKDSREGDNERSIEVHRKWQHNYRQILSDQLIDVEESVYLNLIMQHFSYTVTCAVCTRTGAKQLQILKRFSTQVFASPSRHCMDGKASREEITYPDIVFSIHNYDDLFTDCVVHDSELICVELVARDRLGEFQGVLFLGSVRYEAILDVYQAKSASSFSAYQPSTWFRAPRRVEFLRMRGPRGKGRAEVAVSRAEAAPPTPESELATTLATQNYHQQQLDYPSDEVEAGPRRTRRFSGTNRQQQQQQPHQQFRGSGKPPSRVGSAASLRSWGLSGLMKKSRSDSENVVDATTASSTSAAATVGAVASNA
uniref:DUF2045 domain containing protein n=1 Tax=Macrostomum lignano TaxID=282301 RepID=A0A1I8GG99_9PLAT